jgi:hypothetical protein
LPGSRCAADVRRSRELFRPIGLFSLKCIPYRRGKGRLNCQSRHSIVRRSALSFSYWMKMAPLLVNAAGDKVLGYAPEGATLRPTSLPKCLPMTERRPLVDFVTRGGWEEEAADCETHCQAD